MRILRAIALAHGNVGGESLLPQKRGFQSRSNPLPMMFKYATGAVAMQNIISQITEEESAFVSTKIARVIEGIVREKYGFYVVQKLLTCCNSPALAPLFKAMCDSAGM